MLDRESVAVHLHMFNEAMVAGCLYSRSYPRRIIPDVKSLEHSMRCVSELYNNEIFLRKRRGVRLCLRR